MDGNQSESAQAHAGKTGKRPPRSIRFYDSEWERIETFAEQRGLTATEFVRFATRQSRGMLSTMPGPTGSLRLWNGPSATAT